MLLFEEVIGAFQYADDSSGNIGFLVTETLEFIVEIATSYNELDYQKTEMFLLQGLHPIEKIIKEYVTK